MAPSNKQAKSATAHSGRFSLRIAIRSPRFNPHLTSARLTPTTCLYKSREDSDAHCGVVFRIITRDSSRSPAEKKISLSVFGPIGGRKFCELIVNSYVAFREDFGPVRL